MTSSSARSGSGRGSDSATTVDPATIGPSTRRAFAITVGLAVLFIFLQSLTAGEFITEGLSHDSAEVWTEVHGFIAYPIMIFSLVATVIAARRLRAVRNLALVSGALFVGSIAQWLLGHAISTLHMDWVTPFHVVLAFVIYGIAIWLSVQSAALRRGR